MCLTCLQECYNITTRLTKPLPVLRFDHLPPSAFLCALKHAPEVTPFSLKVSLEDWELFKVIMDNSKVVLNAMKALAGKQKMSEGPAKTMVESNYFIPQVDRLNILL